VTDRCVESAVLVTSRFSLEAVAMDTPLEVYAMKTGYCMQRPAYFTVTRRSIGFNFYAASRACLLAFEWMMRLVNPFFVTVRTAYAAEM